MKYEPISSELFIRNREKFSEAMQASSMLILHANDLHTTNGDGTFTFKQNTDLFYLTGINQEETLLIMFPDAPKSTWKEVLFIKETNEQIAIWEGKKLSKSEARLQSGIQTIYWYHEFWDIVHTLIFEVQSVYLYANEHIRAKVLGQGGNDRLRVELQQKYPLHAYLRLQPILSLQRSIKSDREIDLIQKAIDITHKSFLRILSFVRPEVTEYQIEAEISHEFLWNRATGHAYHPIIASGANACVLHYNDNNQICQDGDLILLDFGAEYGQYMADLTRTIPVNGVFNERQKQVYQGVLRIQRFAMSILRPGLTFETYQQQVVQFVEQELVLLGLLTQMEIDQQDPDRPLYRKYFMHGTSHFLGMEVHDVGSRFLPFEEGMVFTVEPGLYIPQEKIGIRLENNVLLVKEGIVDLTKDIPIEIEEIENLMVGNVLKKLK